MFGMLSGRTPSANSAQSQAADDDIYSFDKKMSRGDSASASFGGPRTGKLMTGSQGDGRPMTSVRAAGYSSRGRTAVPSTGFDPFNQASRSQEKVVISPEDQIKDLEKRVHALIHESCVASKQGNYKLALEKAKDAGKKERQIARQKENASAGGDQMNLDLTYCVLFNLANQYAACKMYQEALNTFAVIVKNKAFNGSGRLRVNMGNIFFEQGNYSQAIKMYRMALDQIPATNKDTRLKILRNIGIASIKMGQFQDAVSSFEAIMEVGADCRAGFNLVLCYFALGDKEKMKKGFQKLLNLKLPIVDKFEEHVSNAKDEPIHDHEVFSHDALREISREQRKRSERFLLLSAKLIAPAIDQSFSDGYDWVVETIKNSPHSEIASELEISKAIQYLKQKEFGQAIETLKSFENKDQKLVGAAATNLSFLYFLDGDVNQSEVYAEIAMSHDRYNAKAQTNRGNVYFQHGDFEKAKEHYEEAINLDAVSTEAMFNLALIYKKQENYPKALQWFEKLHSILANSAQVIFQIADIHDLSGNLSAALEWYNILISVVPTDPGILARLGGMFERDGDKSQAFQYYSESYRYFPSNLAVISWLGTYYVECEVYEQAIQFFERATLIQPNEAKWFLMIASCYRRSGNYQLAFDTYKLIHDKFPENVECLRFLVRISTDLGMSVAGDYANKLSRMETKGGPEVDALTEAPKVIEKKAQYMREKPEEDDWHEDVNGLLPE